MNRQRHLLPLWLLVMAASCGLSSRVSAAGYTNVYNSAYFSWLDQYSVLPANVGSNACVPSSAVNALSYLQNSAPGYFGTSLIGTNYASWLATGQTLISVPYMDTDTNGTALNHIPYAMNKYLVTTKGFTNIVLSGMFDSSEWSAAPYDKPSYITDGMPTTSFLINALAQNSAILMTLSYTNTGAHEVTVTGLNWSDLNGNSIMDLGEARLSFVDPLDPSMNYSGTDVLGGAKFSQGDIWWDTNSARLRITYDQYGGSLPWENTYETVSSSYINSMFAVAVPEPSTWALLALSGLVMAGRCRRQATRLSKHPSGRPDRAACHTPCRRG